MQLPRPSWKLAFFGLVFAEAAVVLALEGYVFGKFQYNINSKISSEQRKSSNTVAIPTYLALFIFAEVFHLGMTFDALRMKNTIQVIGLCIFNTALLVYAGIQYEQIKTAVDYLSSWHLDGDMENYVLSGSAWGEMRATLIAIICVIGVIGFAMFYVCYKLYIDFGWSIYKQIGADIEMKHRYLAYQIFMTLLKFDAFFFLGFTVQFCVIILNRKDVEFGLTIAVIPCTVVALFLTMIAIRNEIKSATALVFVVFLAGMAYFMFKLIRMYQPSQVSKYVAARKSLTTFAVITLFLLLVSEINMVFCARNFNKGLKPYIASQSSIRRLWTRSSSDSGEAEKLEGEDSMGGNSPSSPGYRRRFSLD
ncbi:hypothetical protein BZA70DRAFT_19333 [Myxozyma melibiosi]|uniref:Uncharacterized protein n=1 Tax=Myxozyma melibiosi TaxID=54550 RepID=A0ABR1FCK4_9ASCO